MLRGINHQVIEITDTENRYYERALLVVRPQYSGVQRQVLEKEAKKLVKKMSGLSVMKSKKMLLYRLGGALLAASGGALLTVLGYTLL